MEVVKNKFKEVKNSIESIKKDAEEYIMNEFIESMIPKIKKFLPKALPKAEKQLIEFLDDKMIIVKKGKDNKVEVFVMKQSKMTLKPKEGENPIDCIDSKTDLNELIELLILNINK